ncbi:MAG: peptidoglycan-binding protein [Verrucomicrobia bacterium]|nr:peptidoglycan-binding protein [Verrucomicrobiota bacterium]
MGKLIFCFLFAAAASWTQAQTHPVIVVAPHIEAPVAIHVPQVNLPQARLFANTQQFRSLYNPLDNNPLVNQPLEQPKPAPRPRVQTVPSEKRVPLGTTVETMDRTAVNGYTVGQVRQVQEALHRLGYYNGDVDGDFGPNTQNALQRYQLSAGEPVTGTLTRGVLGRLGVSGK